MASSPTAPQCRAAASILPVLEVPAAVLQRWEEAVCKPQVLCSPGEDAEADAHQ